MYIYSIYIYIYRPREAPPRGPDPENACLFFFVVDWKRMSFFSSLSARRVVKTLYVTTKTAARIKKMTPINPGVPWPFQKHQNPLEICVKSGFRRFPVLTAFFKNHQNPLVLCVFGASARPLANPCRWQAALGGWVVRGWQGWRALEPSHTDQRRGTRSTDTGPAECAERLELLNYLIT